MYVKKMKRICDVKGCKNTDTYSISLSREAGNSVIICKSCLGKALSAIDDVPLEPYSEAIRVAHEDAPSLSLGGTKKRKAVVAKVSEEEIIETPADAVEQEAPEEIEAETEDSTATPPADAPEFVCPHCGQICKSELGLRSHINAKHKDLL